MRDFTKSVLSYTWATSLFGVQQMFNLLSAQGSRREHPATEGFNSAARCNVEQMGDTLRATFRAGDNVGRGLMDLTFGVMTLGLFDGGGRRRGCAGGGCGGGRSDGRGEERGNAWGYDRGGDGRQAANAGQQAADAVRQGARAMGQAAGAVGQAVGGAAPGWGSDWGSGWGCGGRQGEPTGWGPMPPPPQDSNR